MAKAEFMRKKTWKQILSIALAVLAGMASIFGVIKLTQKLKSETKEIHPIFSVGGLTNVGDHEERDDTIYTKDAFEAKGLEIKLDFDGKVKYQVFFYDELDKFISCTEVYTESKDISVPLNARARLEVTPIWGADEPIEKEIKWYETVKYASQLEIRVDRIQRLLTRDFKAYEFTDTTMFMFEDNTYYTSNTAQPSDMYATYTCTINDDYTYMYLVNVGDFFETTDVKLGHVSADGVLKAQYYYEELNALSIDNLISIEKGDVLHFSFAKKQVNVDNLSCLIYLG